MVCTSITGGYVAVTVEEHPPPTGEKKKDNADDKDKRQIGAFHHP